MKKIMYTFLCMAFSVVTMNAQVTVDFDADADFIGFANVFETPANGGGFVFGEVWGVPDLKTVVNTGAGTVTLQPNFNTWDVADPFWVTPGGEGNKIFEGNTFVEDGTLVGEVLTFRGRCDSFTIDNSYAVKAFIKVFNSDFSVLKEVNTILVAGENFEITYDDVEPADAVVQYGFAVTGLVADPADEGTLGNVVISAPVLSINDNSLLNLATYPNPTSGVITLRSSNELTNATVFNALGQEVKSFELNSSVSTLDISELAGGMYFVRVSAEAGEEVIQIIKK